MEKEKKNNEPDIDAGDALISWKTWEFEPFNRGVRWYVYACIIGIVLMVYAVLTVNPIFALIILMTGVLVLLNSFRKPKRIQIHITNAGVVIGEDFHEYKDLKDFSIVYDPPVTTVMYIDFQSIWKPLISINFEQTDPIFIRDTLLHFIDENLEREEERLSDLVQKVHKI